MGFTLHPQNKEIYPLDTQWVTYCTALEEGPGLVVGMDKTIGLGMFFYDEAPRNKNKAFAGSDGFYILSSEATQMGELLKKKIKIHQLRIKEFIDMDFEAQKYAKDHYAHRLPVSEELLDRWRELADFLINSGGYYVR